MAGNPSEAPVDGAEPDAGGGGEVSPLVEEVRLLLETRSAGWGRQLRNIAGLALSLLLFIGLERIAASWAEVITLAAVIAVHELGHVAGMKLFGYRDVSFVFIPFVGAAATGSQTCGSGAQRAVVDLLGPLPGIAIGILTGILYLITDQPLIALITRAFLLINAFNLLPFYPLDGARFLDDCIFSRNRILEVLFKVLTGAALLALAFVLQEKVLVFFAIAVLLAVPRSYRMAIIASEIKRGIPQESRMTDSIPSAFMSTLVDQAGRLVPMKRRAAKTIAPHVREIWRRVCVRPPASAAAAGLLALYLACLVIGILAPLVFEAVVHLRAA